jgi:hypothetical protein
MMQSQFSDELQERIIRGAFDKSVPGGYASLAGMIMGNGGAQQQQSQQQQQQQTGTGQVTISKEEYDRLTSGRTVQNDQRNVNDAVAEMFPYSNRSNEQNSKAAFVPNNQQTQNQQQNQGQSANEQDNSASDIMQRIFGNQTDTQNQQQQNDQTNNVNNNRNEDDTAFVDNVRKSIADVCTSRSIDPKDFVSFMSQISIADIGDMYVAYRNLAEQQNQGQGDQANQQNMQQSGNQQQASQQGPINLAEIPPNPQNYNNEQDRYRGAVSKYWQH